MSDRPVRLTVTVTVVVNSSDGSRQDAVEHLNQMMNFHGLAGIQMAALESPVAYIQRSDYQHILTNDQAQIAKQAAL